MSGGGYPSEEELDAIPFMDLDKMKDSPSMQLNPY